MHSCLIGTKRYCFDGLRELMAKSSPHRSGDVLAGLGAESAEERAAAQILLADVPLAAFLEEQLIPYEMDEVTRLIVDTHDKAAFAGISSLTVGMFREWLLGDQADAATLAALAPGVTPEMAAATSKIMRNQDLILAAHQDARAKVEATMQEKMQEVTGGLPLPPGMKLF